MLLAFSPFRESYLVFKAGFPKVSDIARLGAILVSWGGGWRILVKGRKEGGDFIILGSHKIFTFYLIILLILACH